GVRRRGDDGGDGRLRRRRRGIVRAIVFVFVEARAERCEGEGEYETEHDCLREDSFHREGGFARDMPPRTRAAAARLRSARRIDVDFVDGASTKSTSLLYLLTLDVVAQEARSSPERFR